MLTIGLEPIYVQALLEWNWATLWPRLSCPRSTRLNSPAWKQQQAQASAAPAATAATPAQVQAAATPPATAPAQAQPVDLSVMSTEQKTALMAQLQQQLGMSPIG